MVRPSTQDINLGHLYAANRALKRRFVDGLDIYPDKRLTIDYNDTGKVLYIQTDYGEETGITGLKSVTFKSLDGLTTKTVMRRMIEYIESPFPGRCIVPENDCHIGMIKFTKPGCLTSSCYPYDDKGKPLDKDNMGNNPWCFTPTQASGKNPIQPTFLFHRWFRNRCELESSFIKRWALHPEIRRDHSVKGVTDVPPFKWDDNDFRYPIKITPAYCKRMGMSYNNLSEDCYVTFGQKVADYFIGGLYKLIVEAS